MLDQLDVHPYEFRSTEQSLALDSAIFLFLSVLQSAFENGHATAVRSPSFDNSTTITDRVFTALINPSR